MADWLLLYRCGIIAIVTTAAEAVTTLTLLTMEDAASGEFLFSIIITVVVLKIGFVRNF